MTISSVNSIKSLFDLASWTEEELQEKINLLKDTTNQISITLENSFKVYKNVINTDAQQIVFDNTISELNKFRKSEGLRLFVYLFGFYQNKIFLPQEIPLDNLVNILTFIDKFPPQPKLPWPRVEGFLLFNEQTEAKLTTPGTYDINQNDFLGRIKFFNSEEDIVIGNLSSAAYNLRRNDIYNLFINLKIAECIGQSPTVEDLDLKDQKVLNYRKNTKVINYQGKEISIDKYVSTLFKNAYQATKKEIQQLNLVPKNVKVDNILWDRLLARATHLKDQLILMQAEYRDIIYQFEFDINKNKLLEKNELYQEVRQFLNKNKDKKEYLKYKIDERFLPERKIIESITGGSGLMKRIAAIEGGVIEFKRVYPQWIINRINKEKAIVEADPAFKSLEIRESNKTLDPENMRLSNERQE